MKDTDEKKSFKAFLQESKEGFKIAVKDKKRWMTCLIEILIAGALIAIDLITKKYVYGYCNENGKINIIKGVICFQSTENTGASFGIFGNQTTALTVVSLICACILFLFIFYSYPRRNLWLRSALILILAGAIGNIIDRLALGYVRDFIYFELINFAIFNFADSCLTVGTIVLIIYMLFFYSKDEKEAAEKKAQAAEKIVESETAETDAQNEEAVDRKESEEAATEDKEEQEGE